MRIRMQCCRDSALLRHSKWGTFVCGPHVDDRGLAAREFGAANVRRTLVARYDPLRLEFWLDDVSRPPDEAEAFLEPFRRDSLLIEATTLGFAEVFLLCKAAKDLGMPGVSLLYTEPNKYREHLEKVLHPRHFDLTEDVEEFSAIPGATLMLEDNEEVRAVFFLGFEWERLYRAMEQNSIPASQSIAVFGVPAFQPGWEMHSFANNVSVVRDLHIPEIAYAGAHNPAGAYGLLRTLRQSCSRRERMLIAPIGTKPHGIGAALFACAHDDVGVIYDYPHRSKGRSSALTVWHLFDVTF